MGGRGTPGHRVSSRQERETNNLRWARSSHTCFQTEMRRRGKGTVGALCAPSAHPARAAGRRRRSSRALTFSKAPAKRRHFRRRHGPRVPPSHPRTPWQAVSRGEGHPTVKERAAGRGRRVTRPLPSLKLETRAEVRVASEARRGVVSGCTGYWPDVRRGAAWRGVAEPGWPWGPARGRALTLSRSLAFATRRRSSTNWRSSVDE